MHSKEKRKNEERIIDFQRPIGQRQEYHRQLADERAPRVEVGFLYQLYLSCPSRHRAEWSRVFLPVSRGIQVQD